MIDTKLALGGSLDNQVVAQQLLDYPDSSKFETIQDVDNLPQGTAYQFDSTTQQGLPTVVKRGVDSYVISVSGRKSMDITYDLVDAMYKNDF